MTFYYEADSKTGSGVTMTEANQTTLQEIFFDLCDLIDSGEADNIALTDFAEFSTLSEFLIEQRDKIARFT